MKRLEDWNCAPPAFGAALAFPDTDFDEQPQEDVLRGIVLGRSHLRWFKEALPAVAERALPPPHPARGSWIERLHQLWGETWVPDLSLGTRVKALGERRFALDAAQLEALDGLAENGRVLVEGGAGSGKTLLAAEAARREAAGGKRVLLLCFTAPLRSWLAARLAGTGVEVQTVSGLAKELAEEAGGPAPGADLTANEYWRATYEAAADAAERRWDAIVVDEGQDLTFEAWFFLRELAEGARLWAFHDPRQGFWADRTPPADLFATRYRLPRGQRCPAGIEALAERYAGGPGDELAISAAARHGILEVVACPDPAKVAEVVGAEMDRLLSERLSLADIGVVSLRGQTAGDAVHQQPRIGRHAFVLADHPAMEGRLVADTFLRWKGLERPAIIVAEVGRRARAVRDADAHRADARARRGADRGGAVRGLAGAAGGGGPARPPLATHGAAAAPPRAPRSALSGRRELQRGDAQRLLGGAQDARAVAVRRDAHLRVEAHPLDDRACVGAEEAVAEVVDAAPAPFALLEDIVRDEDRQELLDERAGRRGHQQRRDRPVVDAEPAEGRERLAPLRLPRRPEQDLLLDRDVPEESLAERVVGRASDLTRRGHRPREEVVEAAVVRGEVACDGARARVRGHAGFSSAPAHRLKKVRTSPSEHTTLYASNPFPLARSTRGAGTNGVTSS